METGTCNEVRGWGGTNLVRFTNVSTQQGSVIPPCTVTTGYVSSHFSILHKDTQTLHAWPRKLDFQK